MRLNSVKIVLLIAIFVPFENFAIKWIPGGDIFRFIPELSLYVLLAFEFTKKIVYKKCYIYTPINFLLLTFIFLALVSFTYQQSPLLEGIRNFRTLIRYFTAFFIVLYGTSDSKDVRFLINSILVITTINCLTGFFQRAFGVHSFWLPENTELEIGGMSTSFKSVGEGQGGGREMGSVIGMTGDTVYLGLFLIIALPIIYFTLSLEKKHQIKLWCLLAATFILQFFTYSTGSLLAMAGSFGICLLVLKHYGRILYGSLAVISLLPVLMFLGDYATDKSKQKEQTTSPIDNLSLLFNNDYIDGLQNSRLWVLRDVGREVIRWDKPIGYSASPNYARAQIAENSGTYAFDKLIEYDAMEDVYWIAMFAYYGYVGVMLFSALLLVLLYISIYVYKNSYTIEYKILAGSYIAILAGAFVVCFIVRAFEFRIFSYYLWLIPAFIMKEYLDLKNSSKTVVIPHD